MKLRFAYMDVANFRSFHKQALTFPASTGLYFIRGNNLVEPRLGSNGSGKSSLLDAVCWCLYGRTPDGLRSTDIRRWQQTAETSVTLGLLRDNKESVVKRTSNPNALELNGKETSQEKIEELVGLSFPTFCQTVLLAQGQPLFLDLQPADKLALLSEVLGLDRWLVRSDATNERVIKLTEAWQKLKAQYDANALAKPMLEKQLQEVKAKHKEWAAEQKAIWEKASKELQQQQAALAKAQDEYDKVSVDFDGAALKARENRESLLAMDKLITSLKNQLAEHKKAVAEARKGVEQLESNAVAAKNYCYACGQAIDNAEARKHISEHLAHHKAELVKIINRPEPVAPARLDALIKSHGDATKRDVAFNREADELRLRMDRLGPKLGELKGTVKQLELASEPQADPFADTIKELRNRIEVLGNDMKQAKANLDKSEAIIDRSTFWIKGFKEVRLYALTEMLAELELVTNSYLEAIGLHDWHLQYQIEKETKSGTVQRGVLTTINSPSNREPVRWQSWSGGEAQRLRLAASLALSECLLRQAGVEPQIEFIDEPTRHMSKEGVGEMVDFLADRAQQAGRVTFFADHLARESTLFAGTLVVQKDKTGSHAAWE